MNCRLKFFEADKIYTSSSLFEVSNIYGWKIAMRMMRRCVIGSLCISVFIGSGFLPRVRTRLSFNSASYFYTSLGYFFHSDKLN